MHETNCLHLADNFNPLIMHTYFTQTQSQPVAVTPPPLIRIAYFIMVHHEPEVFKKLFYQIHTRDQFYLIHIDRKAKSEFTEEIQQFLIQFPNAYVLQSMNINPGGFSMIQAELDAMEYLLNVSSEWDFFINLSGDDYPLKNQNIIRQFLSDNTNKNFIFYYDQKFYRPDTLQRIQNHFTELAYKISSLIYKREFMKGITPYIGGKWFIFTRDTCAFMCRNDKVVKFKNFYLHTFLSGDSFFQTVLMNTTFHDIAVNDDKRMLIKSSKVTKQNPEIYINKLKQGNHLFIRKLNHQTDTLILRYIEENYNLPLSQTDQIGNELKTDENQKN